MLWGRPFSPSLLVTSSSPGSRPHWLVEIFNSSTGVQRHQTRHVMQPRPGAQSRVFPTGFPGLCHGNPHLLLLGCLHGDFSYVTATPLHCAQSTALCLSLPGMHFPRVTPAPLHSPDPEITVDSASDREDSFPSRPEQKCSPRSAGYRAGADNPDDVPAHPAARDK